MSRLKLFAMMLFLISLAIAQEQEIGGSLLELQVAYTKQRIKLLSLKSFMKNQIIEKLQIDVDDEDNIQQIVIFLEQISEQVHQQYLSLVQEYNYLKAKVRNDMETPKKIIEANEKKLQWLAHNQIFLEQQIETLTKKIKIILQELINLGARDKMLNKILSIEQQMYQYRKFRDESTFYSLTLCIQKLQQLQSKRGLFLQKDLHYISQNLKQVSLNNPLDAFLLISQKFNKQKLDQVINVLIALKNQIEVRYRDDRQKEKQFIQRYTTLIILCRIQKQNLLQKAGTLNQRLETKQYNLKQNNYEQQLVSKIIKLEKDVLTHLNILAIQIDQSYEKRILEAEDADQGVKEALNILKQHLSAVLVLDFQRKIGQSSDVNESKSD